MKLKAYKYYQSNDPIYINRIAPSADSVIISFDTKEDECEVLIYSMDKIIRREKTNKKTILINDLPKESELSVEVISNNYKSIKRKFHTGDYKHSLINYVDKEEKQYLFSGNFLGSPFIIRFKDKLWVTMDIFKNGGTIDNGHIETMLFNSINEGKTWDFVTDLVPAQWGRLFVVNDTLYYYGSNLLNHTLDLISSKDGYDWSESISFCDGGNTSPTANVVNDKYVIFAMRYANPNNDSQVVVAKGEIEKGLMNKDAWSFSNVIIPDFAWGGDQNIHYAEEGNVVELNNEIYVLYRFACRKSLMLHFDTNTNKLDFYKIIDFEGGWCKFYIQKYKDTYYAMGNHLCFPRQILKLYESKDLEHWEIVKVIDDITHLNKDFNGIQYPSFFIENDKIYTVFRIALNGSETFHNSNAIGFEIINLK